MKKYLSLLLFALLLNGCDDGDLTVDSIDFEDLASQNCDTLNSLIYKLKTQESLLLQLPPSTIKNEATADGTPITLKIDNSSYRVVYRAYDGAVATTNICGTIPPKTPNVTEEWQATSGVIEIISKEVKETNTTTLATKITGYTHTINFKNITFLKPSGISQVEPIFPFGDFKTTIATPVEVDFTDDDANYCATAKKIYNDNGTSALVIKNLSDKLILNEVTPVGQPRTGLINETATTNNVYYETYAGTLPTTTTDYFCEGKTSTPPVKSTWVANAGDATKLTGIIEVTTTLTGGIYRHKVVLRTTTLKKGNSSFMLGTEFLVGTITGTP
jgi:hypothetical protein